jgi:hypothetical protein
MWVEVGGSGVDVGGGEVAVGGSMTTWLAAGELVGAVVWRPQAASKLPTALRTRPTKARRESDEPFLGLDSKLSLAT